MTPAWTELSFIAACALLAIVMGTALVVLWLIAMKKIDLSLLLTDGDSTKASLSRFQFLLFTFVVVGLFLLLSVEAGAFVDIPNGVLALMGISAGSYAVSKGINAGAADKAAKKADK